MFGGKGRANWIFWMMISVTRFCEEHVMNDHLHGFVSRGVGSFLRVCVHESKVVSSLVEEWESGRRSVKRRRRLKK